MRCFVVILFFAPLCLLSQNGDYKIIRLPVCWNSGKPTSITRLYLINQDGVKLLNDFTVTGQVVNINNDPVSIGYCECSNSNSGLSNTILHSASLYAIKSMPICWRMPGQNIDLVRVYLNNHKGVRILNDYDIEGNPVGVLGGTLNIGYCNCEE